VSFRKRALLLVALLRKMTCNFRHICRYTNPLDCRLQCLTLVHIWIQMYVDEWFGALSPNLWLRWVELTSKTYIKEIHQKHTVLLQNIVPFIRWVGSSKTYIKNIHQKLTSKTYSSFAEYRPFHKVILQKRRLQCLHDAHRSWIVTNWCYELMLRTDFTLVHIDLYVCKSVVPHV